MILTAAKIKAGDKLVDLSRCEIHEVRDVIQRDGDWIGIKVGALRMWYKATDRLNVL